MTQLTIAAGLLAVALAGCTSDTESVTQAQAKIAGAEAEAEAEMKKCYTEPMWKNTSYTRQMCADNWQWVITFDEKMRWELPGEIAKINQDTRAQIEQIDREDAARQAEDRLQDLQNQIDLLRAEQP